jgi:hypothetical protein
MRDVLLIFVSMMLLSGCRTATPPVVIADADAMLYLEQGLRPEILLFPEYLFMEGLELDQHGRIPETDLIGVDMKSKLSLETLIRRFHDVLVSKDWMVAKAEMLDRSFRLVADLGEERLEIRAVQGSGAAYVFMLYQPAGQQAADAVAD